MAKDERFAGFPSAVVYKEPVVSKEVKAEPVQHLLWGDWLKLEGSTKGAWLKIWSRNTVGWVHKDSIQNERLLEIVFVDIGQGDGCLIATPWDKHIIVDAGQSDTMFRSLRGEFGM